VVGKVDEMRWTGKDQRERQKMKGKTMDGASAPAPTIALFVSAGASRAAMIEQQQNTQCGNGVTETILTCVINVHLPRMQDDNGGVRKAMDIWWFSTIIW